MNDFQSQEWVQALGWALLHSLWQLLVVWALAWFVWRATRLQTPDRRYVMMVGVLVLCLAVVVGAFLRFWALTATPVDSVGAPLPPFPTQTPLTAIGAGTEKKIQPGIDWKHWLNLHLYWFTLAWLVGVLLLGIRAMSAFVFLQYLRWEGVKPAAMEWQVRFARLKEKAGISNMVGLLESAIVKAPVAFGYFKPVVLAPLGWLAALPPEQVESILLHELAHIKRADYLVNALLSLIEVLLFYHPAVHWIAARIRELREECCDDWVVAQGSDATIYAESLLTIANNQTISLAMNASSSSSHLNRRIRRLLTPPIESQRSNFTWALAPAITATLVVLFSVLLPAQSSVVSISADKMNVMYIGVDNPLTVAVAGIPADKIKLASNDMELIELGAGKYTAHPKNPGEAIVQVFSDDKVIKEMTFRVKHIPEPMILFNGMTGGEISAEKFKTSFNLHAQLDADFEGMECMINYYSLLWFRPTNDYAIDAVVRKGKLSEVAQDIISKATDGDFYYFDEIKCLCPGSDQEFEPKSIQFRIKD